MQLTDLQFWTILKKRLGIPYTFFEWDYATTIRYIRDVTMREFSQYAPHKMYLQVTENDLIEGTTGSFKIPYDGEVMTIINVIPSNMNDLVLGYPYNPIVSTMDSAIDYAVGMQEATPGSHYSSIYNIGFELLQPNIVKIIPAGGYNSFMLEMEVAHTSFETIQPRFGKDFIDLCIASVKEALGEIRSKYSEIQTPFGSIQLNADALKNEAETTRTRIIERLQQLPPNIHVTY